MTQLTIPDYSWETQIMALRINDWQSESDLDSIRNSCEEWNFQMGWKMLDKHCHGRVMGNALSLGFGNCHTWGSLPFDLSIGNTWTNFIGICNFSKYSWLNGMSSLPGPSFQCFLWLNCLQNILRDANLGFLVSYNGHSHILEDSKPQSTTW